MTTAQEGRQIAVRALTGTALDYNGDWSALFDQAGIAQLGGWDGRFLAWINLALSTSYTNVNDAMAAYAVASGATNWSSVTSLAAGGGGGGGAPVNSVAPLITNPSVQQGFVAQAQILSVSTGTWTGTPTFSYQWRRGGANISGANASTYTVQAADDALTVDCVVTATIGLSANATSTNNPVGIAGTLRLNDDFSVQGSWSSTGQYAWVGGKLVITASTQFNASHINLTLTAGKVLRTIWDVTVAGGSSLQLFVSATGNPPGAIRSTNGTFTDDITLPASPTQMNIMAATANCSGTVDNMLIVERP